MIQENLRVTAQTVISQMLEGHKTFGDLAQKYDMTEEELKQIIAKIVNDKDYPRLVKANDKYMSLRSKPRKNKIQTPKAESEDGNYGIDKDLVKKRKELVETKNQADNMVYSLEKMLKENGDKISEEDKKTLEAEIEKDKKVFEGDNLEDIKAALESLTKVSNDIFTKMYQNASANAQNAGANNAGNNNKNDDGDPEVIIDDNK